MGLCLQALNQRRVGDRDRATRTLVVAIATAAMLVVAGLRFPPLMSLTSAAMSLSVWYYAHQEASAFDTHVARGGQQEGWLKVIGLGLLVLLAFVVIPVVITVVKEVALLR
jgi:hypothetical protein